jgi:hypothetical protein
MRLKGNWQLKISVTVECNFLKDLSRHSDGVGTVAHRRWNVKKKRERETEAGGHST